MQFTILLFMVILASLQLFSIDATGQGTVGLHAISDRYVLVTDSNFISLIVVDMLLGGIAGILTFPTSLYNKETKYDIHFVSITSCDECLYIHVSKMHWNFPGSTQEHIIEIGPLEKPLLQMAKENDFSAFSSLSFENDAKPVWPFPKQYHSKVKDFKMMRTHPSGGVGFMVHQEFGILRYKLDSKGKMIEEGGDLFLRCRHQGMAGINFSSSLKYLTTIGFTLGFGKKTKAYIVDVTKAGYPEYASVTEGNMTKLELDELCFTAFHRNIALWDNDDPDTPNFMYVDGHRQGKGTRESNAFLRLTEEGGKWGNCKVILGGGTTTRGWRDGCGSVVRFSRPHDTMISPVSKKLIVTDIDNRAIRLVEPSTESNDEVCVSTVSYDEGLYEKLFPTSDEKQEEQDAPAREPYILKWTMNKETPLEVSKQLCKSSHERENSNLCTLDELRSLFHDDDSSKAGVMSTPFWTKQSCKGCWKRHRGVCQHGDPGWGSGYYMVARGVNLDSSSPNERGIRTECLHQNVTKTPDLKSITSTLCCGDVPNAQKKKDGQKKKRRR